MIARAALPPGITRRRSPRRREPIFVDIDGTLTNRPDGPGGVVYVERVERLKHLVERGIEIVLWSGGGTAYAREFAAAQGLVGVMCVGKPCLIVDDNRRIRSPRKLLIVGPHRFFRDQT